MVSLSKLNLGLLWACVAGTASGCFWVFNNIAWAADVERIEVRLIKRDIRDIKRELAHEDDPQKREDLQEELEEMLDDLCEIKPEDREC